MRAITVFARAGTTVNLWIARIMAWVVLALFVLLLLDVVMRYLVGKIIDERPEEGV